MTQGFQFLCGNYNNINFVFATKFGDHPWHYFKELHSISHEHDSLPPSLNAAIKNFNRPRVIEIFLNDEQAKNYYDHGKFIFKNTELQTFITLENLSPVNKSIKRKGATRDLTFDSGVTNPLLFLADFEKCEDVMTPDEKLEKIRHFVDEEHKAEFSQLRFANDWNTAKTKFLTTYSLPFVENRKRDMNFDFFEDRSLRSFVERKFAMLAKYTTLSPLSQMDMILNELPTNIAELFIVNGKFDCHKNDILDFCDSIEEVSDKFRQDQNTQDVVVEEPLNSMVLFKYDRYEIDSEPSTSSGSRGKAQGSVSNGRVVKRGRKGIRSREDSENQDDTVLERIEEDEEDLDISDRMSNSAESTVSSRNSMQSFSSHISGQSRYSLRRNP